MYELSVVPRFKLYSISYLRRLVHVPRSMCTPLETSCALTPSTSTGSYTGCRKSASRSQRVTRQSCMVRQGLQRHARRRSNSFGFSHISNLSNLTHSQAPASRRPGPSPPSSQCKQADSKDGLRSTAYIVPAVGRGARYYGNLY